MPGEADTPRPAASYLRDRLAQNELTAKQGQDCLWSGVGLGQRRDTGLEGNLRLGQVGSLLRQIRVANARFRCREVGQLGLCEVDRVVECILPLADVRLRGAQSRNRRSESADG
jgi:hypothetical protein